MSVAYADMLTPRVDVGGRLGDPETHDEARAVLRDMAELAGMVRRAAEALSTEGERGAGEGGAPPSQQLATWDPSRPGASPLVVFTGAGISTACGIPDFRGPNGVWTLRSLNNNNNNGGGGGSKAEPVLAPNPAPAAAVPFVRAVPSFAHMALVRLQSLGLLSLVVSQNVDSLHLRSGLPRQALAELHGDVFAERCAECGCEYVRDFEMPSVGFKETGRVCVGRRRREDCRGRGGGRGRGRGRGRGGGSGGSNGRNDTPTPWLPVPACYVANGNPPGTEAFDDEGEEGGEEAGAAPLLLCGGALRDQCLDWDDPLPPRELREAERRASAAAVALCLGTSLQIRPAGDLPLRCVRGGGKLAIVNLQPTPKDRRAAVVCRARCDEAMAALMDALGEQAGDFVRHDRLRVSHVAWWQDAEEGEEAEGEEGEEEAAGHRRRWAFEVRVASAHGPGLPLPALLRRVEVGFVDDDDGKAVAAEGGAAFDVAPAPPLSSSSPSPPPPPPPRPLVVRRRGLPQGQECVTTVLRLSLELDEDDEGEGAGGCRELQYVVPAPPEPPATPAPPPPLCGGKTAAAAGRGAATVVFETQRVAYGARQRELLEGLRRRAAQEEQREAEEEKSNKGGKVAAAGGKKRRAAAGPRAPRQQRYGERRVVQSSGGGGDDDGGDGNDDDDEDFVPPSGRGGGASARSRTAEARGGGGGWGRGGGAVGGAASTARPRQAPKVLDL
jgi:NAD-dependent SIR2 family protein deacetylase